MRKPKSTLAMLGVCVMFAALSTGCGTLQGAADLAGGAIDLAGGAARLTVDGTKATIHVAGAGIRVTGQAFDTAGKGVQLVGKISEHQHRKKMRGEQRRVESARAAAKVRDAEADLLRAELRLAALRREQLAQR